MIVKNIHNAFKHLKAVQQIIQLDLINSRMASCVTKPLNCYEIIRSCLIDFFKFNNAIMKVYVDPFSFFVECCPRNFPVGQQSFHCGTQAVRA